jgi:hypothetical protein
VDGGGCGRSKIRDAFELPEMTPRFRSILVKLAVVATTVIVVSGCLYQLSEFFSDRIIVVVKNSDPATIKDVRVFMGGQWLELGAIEPDKTARASVVPTGDSGVAVKYVDAADIERLHYIDCYVTGGYHGRFDAEIQGGKVVRWHADF